MDIKAKYAKVINKEIAEKFLESKLKDNEILVVEARIKDGSIYILSAVVPRWMKTAAYEMTTFWRLIEDWGCPTYSRDKFKDYSESDLFTVSSVQYVEESNEWIYGPEKYNTENVEDHPGNEHGINPFE